jgi:hypothetical protein
MEHETSVIARRALLVNQRLSAHVRPARRSDLVLREPYGYVTGARLREVPAVCSGPHIVRCNSVSLRDPRNDRLDVRRAEEANGAIQQAPNLRAAQKENCGRTSGKRA